MFFLIWLFWLWSNLEPGKANKREKERSPGDLMAKVSRIEEKLERRSQADKARSDEVTRIKLIETKLDQLLQKMSETKWMLIWD